MTHLTSACSGFVFPWGQSLSHPKIGDLPKTFSQPPSVRSNPNHFQSLKRRSFQMLLVRGSHVCNLLQKQTIGNNVPNIQRSHFHPFYLHSSYLFNVEGDNEPQPDSMGCCISCQSFHPPAFRSQFRRKRFNLPRYSTHPCYIWPHPTIRSSWLIWQSKKKTRYYY